MMHDNSSNSGNNRNYALLLPVISVTVSGRCAIHLSSVPRQRKSDIIVRVIRSRFDYGKQGEILTTSFGS